ncbi:MAG: TonB-dependent receptor, partial [Bacteroidales bacterium]|nr:TonB-dependent receptor [Bacteroidales bacterium]
MKILYILLPLALCITVTAQNNPDTNDVFSGHLKLNEVVIHGVTGNTQVKHSPLPVSVINARTLRHTSSNNIVDAVSKQPGMSQVTTGSGISKPVIRGLGYNRVLVVKDGIRQEGQQWGDEHGIEIDAHDVGSVEIIKGPASLMYGSDALAGVLIFNGTPTQPLGTVGGNVDAEYHTNNGLINYSLNLGGNHNGFLWDARYSDKFAHAYRNHYDGYVPNSQFNERALSLKLGLMKDWGYSNLKIGYYNINPSIVEGERDSLTGNLLSDGENSTTYKHGLPFQKVYHHKAVSETYVKLKSGHIKTIVGFQHNTRQEYEELDSEYGLCLHLGTVNYDLRYVSDERNGWKYSSGVNGMLQQSVNKGDEYLIPDYRLADIGVFATGSKSLDRWTFSGGLRFDYRFLETDSLFDDGQLRFRDFSRNYTGLTGSVGTAYSLSENLTAKLNIARGFRAPNISELSSNGQHEGTLRYEIGNADMSPEYSLQADFGIDYSNPIISVQVSAFANRVSNYIYAHRIDSVVEPDLMTFSYSQGDVVLWGGEAGIDLHPVHQLHIGAVFSYVATRLLNQPAEMSHLPFTPA